MRKLCVAGRHFQRVFCAGEQLTAKIECSQEQPLILLRSMCCKLCKRLALTADIPLIATHSYKPCSEGTEAVTVYERFIADMTIYRHPEVPDLRWVFQVRCPYKKRKGMSSPRFPKYRVRAIVASQRWPFVPLVTSRDEHFQFMTPRQNAQVKRTAQIVLTLCPVGQCVALGVS